MSKQQERRITIRRTDKAISQAFQIALSQESFQFQQNEMPFITISGNKDNGVVEAKTYKNAGKVYLYGKGEVFFGIEKVEITKLDGKNLDEPKTVQFHRFEGSDNNLLVIFTHLTQHREAVIYHLIGIADAFESAPSVLHYLQKYPHVQMDGGDIKLTYRPEVMGIRTLTIWYNRNRGYTRAVIESIYNGSKRQYFCDSIISNNWTGPGQNNG